MTAVVPRRRIPPRAPQEPAGGITFRVLDGARRRSPPSPEQLTSRPECAARATARAASRPGSTPTYSPWEETRSPTRTPCTASGRSAPAARLIWQHGRGGQRPLPEPGDRHVDHPIMTPAHHRIVQARGEPQRNAVHLQRPGHGHLGATVGVPHSQQRRAAQVAADRRLDRSRPVTPLQPDIKAEPAGQRRNDRAVERITGFLAIPASMPRRADCTVYISVLPRSPQTPSSGAPGQADPRSSGLGWHKRRRRPVRTNATIFALVAAYDSDWSGRVEGCTEPVRRSCGP